MTKKFCGGPQMGFVSASHTKDGNNEYTVSQTCVCLPYVRRGPWFRRRWAVADGRPSAHLSRSWESKEAYEKWMNSHFRVRRGGVSRMSHDRTSRRR